MFGQGTLRYPRIMSNASLKVPEQSGQGLLLLQDQKPQLQLQLCYNELDRELQIYLPVVRLFQRWCGPIIEYCAHLPQTMLHHCHPTIGTKPPLSTLTFARQNDSRKPHQNQQINQESAPSPRQCTSKSTKKAEQECVAPLQLLLLLFKTCTLLLLLLHF